ncbi:MAG: hypothetical protein V4654_02890 [Bdellovibrionota bacterium]
MKQYFLLLGVVAIVGCSHEAKFPDESHRQPQAIEGETYSPGGRALGMYLCFHRSVLGSVAQASSSEGGVKIYLLPTGNPQTLAARLNMDLQRAQIYFDRANRCYIRSESGFRIPAGTMVKVTYAGNDLVAWGGGRDHTDKFPVMLTMGCPVPGERLDVTNIFTYPFSTVYAGVITATDDENFKCQALK